MSGEDRNVPDEEQFLTVEDIEAQEIAPLPDRELLSTIGDVTGTVDPALTDALDDRGPVTPEIAPDEGDVAREPAG